MEWNGFFDDIFVYVHQFIKSYTVLQANKYQLTSFELQFFNQNYLKNLYLELAQFADRLFFNSDFILFFANYSRALIPFY